MTRRRLALALLLAAGCADPIPELTLRNPDRAAFEAQVYPVLLRDCAFHACHGGSERFFQVFGPGRGRLFALTQPLDPTLVQEIDHSYARALSMIDSVRPDESLLLLKPLSSAAGGVGHEGVDMLGRNVYSAKTDPSYVALSVWVLTAPQPIPAPPVTP